MNAGTVIIDEVAEMDESIFKELDLLLPQENVLWFESSKPALYEQHKLAIWLAIDIVLAIVFVHLLFSPNLLWNLSTPLIKYMP